MSAEPRPRQTFHVLDASAILRLYLGDGPLPTDLEAVMELGCRGEAALLVPDLCWPEMTSVLRKQILRDLLRPEEASALLKELLQLPLRTVATAELCPSALHLSQQHQISVYDACYLALALRHGAVLISADERLAAAARRSGCGG